MNLILCGMPCVGKTTIGEKLAKHLGWEFVDIDHLIEQQAGLACREIVLMKGEAVFRELEKEVVLSLKCTGAVIATGGGILKDPENVRVLKKCGKLIYLKDDPDVLYKRLLAKKELPSYIDPYRPEESFKELFTKRDSLYAQCDETINVNGLTEDEIFSELKLIITG